MLRIEKVTRGTGAIKIISLASAINELVAAGWERFAAQDHFANGQECITEKYIYRVA